MTPAGTLAHDLNARALGAEDGFRQGYNVGYRLGVCDHVLGTIPPDEQPLRDLRVLYITAGIGDPYPALDKAIINALLTLVTQVAVASPEDDVVAAASRIQADVVLALNGVVLPADKVQQLRQQGFKTAIWFTDDPYYTDWTISIAPRYDYVFTLELNCLPFYRKLGCPNVFYLPFAVDPAVFHPKHVLTPYQTDICFIGTAFWNRVELIDYLAPLLADKKVVIAGWWWDRLKNYARLSEKIKLGDWLSAEETASYYNGAKIVINLHRPYDDDSINANSRKVAALSANPRTFEIAACGTLQLSDHRQDMDYAYQSGAEIATYSSRDELIDKIHYYLSHEDERRKVAMNGLLKTRTVHTYKARLRYMLGVIFP